MRASLLFATLAFAACGGSDMLTSDAAPPGPADAATMCKPTPAGSNKCPGNQCPTSWTTDKASWCETGPSPTPVRLETGCQGYDVAVYTAIDEGVSVIYDAADGHFVGIQNWSANGGGSWSCVAGVPATFDAAATCYHPGTALTCN